MSVRERHGLYPPIEPYRKDHLDTGEGHRIYFEESGRRSGKPVVIIHGGPGGGSNPTMRRFHDPSRYRIILFDQRGCGLSTPHASLEANTTWDLVADMERLREALGITRWQLVGGSWGSTLALAYAERHPERVSELVLRGIFLLRRAELEWFYQSGCSWLFPDAFEAFEAVIPPAERGDMIGAYYKRLTGSDPDAQRRAARAWSVWEGTTLSLLHDPERLKLFSADAYAVAFARIECHYFVNGGFFEEEGQLLRDIYRVCALPAVAVHGRYDVVTPLRSAWDLKRAWPALDLRVVADAGHAMTEAGIVHEIVSATRRFSQS